jgi:hypothetical protein
MEQCISRRNFLINAALTVAATKLWAGNRSVAQVFLEIPAEADGPEMPADFIASPMRYSSSQIQISFRQRTPV